MIAPAKPKKGAGRTKRTDAKRSSQNGSKTNTGIDQVERFARRGAAAQAAADQVIARSADGAKSEPVPTGKIVRSKDNREIDTECEAFRNLRASVAEHGILQPLVLRTIERDPGLADCGLAKYEIVIGERRWRCAQDLGLETVPAIVKCIDEQEAQEQRLIENLQREDLRPMDEARGYKRLLDMGLSIADVCVKVSKEKSAVYGRLKLLELDAVTAKSVETGRLPASHAELLTKIKDPEQRLEAVREILEPENVFMHDIEEGEILPFRAAKQLVDEYKERADNLASWQARKAEFEKKGWRVLTDEENGKRNSYGPGGKQFLSLDEWCYDAAQSEQWRKLVPAKHRPTPTLGRDRDDAPAELYDRGEMRKAAEAAGVKFRVDKPGSDRKAQARKREQARMRRAVWDAMIASLVAAAERGGATEKLLRLAAHRAMHKLYTSTGRADPVVKRRGLQEAKHRSTDVLRAHVDKGFNAKQLCGMIVEGIAYEFEPFEWGSTAKWDNGLVELCEVFGVNLERIERDVQASGRRDK